ncbi:MAG: PQQ-binding-like beta-propeller repeat protein [Candidatus Sumerlaeia bacterium]
MSPTRKTALLMMIVAAAFALAVAGRLVVMHRHEVQSGVLVNKEIKKQKEQLAAKPDPKTVESIRQLDRKLRQDYFRARRQDAVGGYMIAAAVIAFVLSGRWFVRLNTQPRRRARLTDAQFAARERNEALAVAGAALILFAGLAVIGKGKPSPYKQNWPNFRGPSNLGIAAAADYPTTWSLASNLNIGWKSPIPAPGKSSPVVWGDRVFLTGGDKAAHHVMCFDRADGRLLWDKSISPPAEIAPSEDAGFAASTGATDGKRFYALFPTGILAAFDFEGNQAWTKQFGIPDNQYGHASSLILHEGTLIVQLDQGSARDKKSRLIGIDAATGNERWSTARDVGSSWATPALIKTPARSELVTCADPWVISYDPAGGKELWRVKALGGDVVPSPGFDGERIFVTTDRTLAIRPGGSGNVTRSNVLWKSNDAVGDIASPVGDGRRVLLVFSAGNLYCINAADGKPAWEKSLECGVTASPVLVGGRVYLCGQDGVTRIFGLGGEYKIEGQGEIGEPIHVTPAFADGEIYIRGAKDLVCVRKRK